MRFKIFISVLFVCFIQKNVEAIGDPARSEAKIDQVYAEYGLEGEGVIFVMLDRGIDYTHPDFIDENGNTRIAYIYDMWDNSVGNGIDGIGTIYNSAQINAVLNGSTPLNTTERHGHGTATTSIACGNGRGTVDRQFQGIAPKATIISVKLVQDYFPPFNGQPGENVLYDPYYIEKALQFVTAKVTELNMPSVTVLNIGSIGGPTDGTSIISRMFDEFSGPGKIFVNGTGDDGGAANRAEGTISQGETVDVLINKGENGILDFDLWYDESDDFTVSVVTPNNTTFGSYAGPAFNVWTTTEMETDFSIYHYGSDAPTFYDADNQKRNLFVRITGGIGVYKIRLTGTAISDGSFSASINPSNFWAQPNNYFNSHVTNTSSINDFSTGLETITPTSYVINQNWIDINGIPRSITGEGNVGEIWKGSSVGPTLDGRYGVDVAAPAEQLFAAYSSNSWYAYNSGNLIQAGNGFYGRQSAVSGANPFVGGVIALMLEVNSNLTPSEVQNALHASARQDAQTGAVPNAIWGYGKLDALTAIELINISCQETLHLMNEPTMDESQIASDTIYSNVTINSPLNITYQAGKTIVLQNEFEVILGATFHAFIEDCGINNLKDTIAYSQYKTTVILNEVTVRKMIDLQVFPNPFDKQTTIHFTVTTPSFIQISLYAVNGKKIRTVTPKSQYDAGAYQIPLQSEGMQSGLYFIQLTCSEGQLIDKIMVVRE